MADKRTRVIARHLTAPLFERVAEKVQFRRSGPSNRSGSAKKRLDKKSVQAAYAGWAPVYDLFFDTSVGWGRRAAVKRINRLSGSILEVGVGTGLSLPDYRTDLTVTGIDLSAEMLTRAKKRVQSKKLKNVTGLSKMDAGSLAFPDHSFEVAVAMYVMTVVPDAPKVMRELVRVVKPGGRIIIVSHLAAEKGIRASVERQLSGFAKRLGWHPDFKREQLTDNHGLILEHEETLAPAGLFTLLDFRRS
ncbi:MAG: class I SAM-dependent methyltransferase [Stappiaceae bacterium]